jgi:hypothetical protein
MEWMRFDFYGEPGSEGYHHYIEETEGGGGQGGPSGGGSGGGCWIWVVLFLLLLMALRGWLGLLLAILTFIYLVKHQVFK